MGSVRPGTCAQQGRVWGSGYAVPEAESSGLVSLTGRDGCFPWQRGQPDPQGRVAQPRPVPKALHHRGGCWAVLATGARGKGEGSVQAGHKGGGGAARLSRGATGREDKWMRVVSNLRPTSAATLGVKGGGEREERETTGL